MVALLVPACGGGGEGQDYYASVQQFESGAKGFRIIATPSVDVYATGYFGGNKYELTEEFIGALTKNYEDSEEGQQSQQDNSQAAREYMEGQAIDASGTIVQGVCGMGGTLTNVDIAYYVEGGKSGTGYMYMTFQTADGTAPRVIANVLGAMTPDQVIQFTNNYLIVTVNPDQKILVSVAGCVMHILFDFNSGVANVGLAYNVASSTEDDENLWGDINFASGPSVEKPALNCNRPFIAVDR